jgi:hypothetical protein
MIQKTPILFLVAITLMGMILLPGRAPAESNRDRPAAREGRIVVARLQIDPKTKPVCLADDFLTLTARETNMPIERTLKTVSLASGELFNYPFVIFTGAQAFELTASQKQRLKRYLDRGGSLLASASCSNAQWAANFKRLMQTLYPDHSLIPIAPDHPIRHTLYDIDRVDTRQPTSVPALQALALGNRLTVVFSPVGLNDTANAGCGCCCCGGNEITNATQVNANILTYALTH